MRSGVLSPCASSPSSPPARGISKTLVGVEQGGAWVGRKKVSFPHLAGFFQCRPPGLAPEADPVTELGPRGGRPPARLGGRVAPADPPQRLPGPPPRGGPGEGRQEQQRADEREQDD